MICLLCKRPSNGPLCSRHIRTHLFDEVNGWVRRKKRFVDRRARRIDRKTTYSTEGRLRQIIKKIFGVKNVVSGVHPIWALSPKGALMEYDIVVPDEKLLIEYSGMQHFEFPNYFHKTRSQFAAQQMRDKLKVDLAEHHGWRLIVVTPHDSVDEDTVRELLS